MPIVECTSCTKRFNVKDEHLGRRAKCPSCEHPFVLSAVEEFDELKVADAIERPEEVSGDVPAGIRRDDRYSNNPTAPKHPFATGVLSFLFYRGTCSAWIILGVTPAVLCVFLVWLARAIGRNSTQHGEAQAMAFAMQIFVIAPAIVFMIVWVLLCWASFFAIIEETAAGNDKIVEWPNVRDYTSWLPSILYLLSMAVVCVLPAAIAVWSLGLPRVWSPVVMQVGLFLTLPLVVLSMLLNSSPLSVFSAEVIRWMSLNVRATLTFYGAFGLTRLVFVAVVEITTIDFDISRLSSLIGMWPLFIAGPATVMGWFLSARLIGRLAWVLSEMPEEREDDSVADAIERPENMPQDASRSSECSNCGELMSKGAALCGVCGHEAPTGSAGRVPVLSTPTKKTREGTWA